MPNRIVPEEPKDGALQVYWIPQVPMKPFTVDVSSIEEAVKVMDILAQYDLFQFHNNIKPDYCNAGGLRVWSREYAEWEDWYDEQSGIDNPEEYLKCLNAKK